MADTICKWCDREISEPDNEHPYWHDSDKFLAMTCSGTPNRRHEPAEPSTEGKPFTEPLEKGWLGTVLKEVRQTADSFEVRAPVAQVDAGKVCKWCHQRVVLNPGNKKWEIPMSKVDPRIFEVAICGAALTEKAEHEPAVAQTELPPILDARLREMASGMDGLTPGDCADGKEIDAMVPELISLRERIASLTQRLQASEAREAELKAEIAKMQMDNVIDYKAACEQHAANYEALERSHKALLEMLKDAYNPNPDRPTLRSELESVLAAAEKL